MWSVNRPILNLSEASERTQNSFPKLQLLGVARKKAIKVEWKKGSVTAQTQDHTNVCGIGDGGDPPVVQHMPCTRNGTRLTCTHT